MGYSNISPAIIYAQSYMTFCPIKWRLWLNYHTGCKRKFSSEGNNRSGMQFLLGLQCSQNGLNIVSLHAVFPILLRRPCSQTARLI